MRNRRNALTPFGKSVKKRMIDLGMGHADLCEACDCGRTYMSDILTGRRSGEKYLPRICKVLALPYPETERKRA